MLWQFSSYALAFFLTGGIIILLMIIVWPRRNSPGFMPFFLTLFAITVWNLAAGMESLSVPLDLKIFWAKIEYLGSTTAAPLLLIFSLEYTREIRYLTKRNIILTMAIPVVILGFTFTNEWHGLIWSGYSPIPNGNNSYIWHHGLVYWIYISYNYLTSILAALLILRAYTQMPKVYRPQLIGLLIGMFFPLFGSLIYSLNLSPFPGFDLSPFSFSLTGVTLFWAIFRHKLFDIVPVARLALIENLTDSVLVLDEFDRIIDLNPAALKLFSVDENVIGKNAEESLPQWVKLSSCLAHAEEGQEELCVKDTPPTYTSIQVVQLKDSEGKINGRLVTLRDITQQKQAEIALRESERKYRSIFENSQVGIFRTEISSGKMLECNDQMAQILGYGHRTDLLSKGMSSLDLYVNPDDRTRMIEELIDGKVENIEIQFRRKDSELILLQFSARIYPELGYLEGVAIDITERKKTENAEREQRQLAEALRDVAAALNSTLNFDEVLNRILENIGKVLPYKTVDILLLDELHKEARVVGCAGYEHFSSEYPSTFQGNIFPLEKTHNLRAIYDSGQPELINDISTYDWITLPQSKWIKSNLCAPIIIKGKVEGFLSLSSEKLNYFKPDHIERLQAFADQAAIAIHNARLFSESQRRMDQMSVLYRVGQALTSNLELNQVLVNLYEQCQLALPIDTFYVAVYQEQTHLLHFPLYVEQGKYLTKNPRDIRLHPGLSGEIIWNQKTLNIPDIMSPDVALQHKQFNPGELPTRSYVGVPLIVRSKAVGVISIRNTEPNVYNAEQIYLLETIANQAAIVIENASLFEQMKQLAITDPLTELYNRRFTEITLVSEFKRCERYETPLAIGYFDIDDFKQVNDNFGHSCGDDVLKIVADQLKASIRFVDFPARVGGDEFLVIFPHTTVNDAWDVLDRFRGRLHQCIISCLGDIVTVSGGVTCWFPGDMPSDILKRVDALLYQAKRLGKNQIIKDAH